MLGTLQKGSPTDCLPRVGRMLGTMRLSRHVVAGMTRNESSDVMDKFNTGEHKVVVCTSAAEEGLDFQACNIVIRYDYVTSLISMMQTRGKTRTCGFDRFMIYTGGFLFRFKCLFLTYGECLCNLNYLIAP